MSDTPRVDPWEVRRDLQTGRGVWLVCAYDDPAKFEQYRIEGALSLREFEAVAPSLPRGAELVFYCA